MILKDKPPKMLVEFLDLMFSELSMNPPPLLLLTVWTNKKEKLSPFTI
jgi:hypothetical protein